ncbi:DUF6519 domain-containing protein [Streptomyces sp. NPDC088921]|uniref:DUF6519 domain-containing protein n=1 Tax=unclassified Streptomyces TaxID=2593676 RepID=UPI00343B7980
MPGDYARMTFDPLDDFNRPWMQQGRVLLQADLNELADTLDHRLRALGLDVLGPCTAPLDLDADTGSGPVATGFRIEADDNSFTIGLGRLYVHGLELDNHGGEPRHVEPGLRDLRGQAPVRYEEQPYYLQPPPISGGRHLVYVDAWEREVTAVEDPRLTDPAVGVDTAVRVQTVWQVKVLGLGEDATGVDCATPEKHIPGWVAATAPSGARLSTVGVGVPADNDPCSLPPDGGYRGWDNRLYRVEVHDGGTLGEATFKWSPDNASVATALLGTDTTRTVLTVAGTGRDDVQRIREGGWVEILDDARELSGRPGFMVRVLTADLAEDATQQVTLSAPLPPDFDPSQPARRTRLRQWYATDSVVGADGVLKVSDALGGFVLQDGVQVTFSATEDSLLRTGDHWNFTARSADGSVQPLVAAPPRGPKHFYGRLAVVDLPGEVIDCRTVWPPLGSGGGCDDCTVCVTPDSHRSGQLTIQMAVNQVRRTGGRVCLASGRYDLASPVVVRSARGVTVSGQGWTTVLQHRGTGAAFEVIDSIGVTLSNMTVLAAPPARSGADAPSVPIGIIVAGSIGVEVSRCGIIRTDLVRQVGRVVGPVLGGKAAMDVGLRPDDRSAWEHTTVAGAAIAPVGLVAGLAVRDCVVLWDAGIAPLYLLEPPVTLTEGGPVEREKHRDRPGAAGNRLGRGFERDYLLLSAFELADSVVVGMQSGVLMDERVMTACSAQIRDSVVWGSQEPAVRWRPHPLGEAPFTVRDCVLQGMGSGVELASSGADLRDSQVIGRASVTDSAQGPPEDGAGVLLDAAVLSGELCDVRVHGCVVIAEGYGVLLSGDHRDVEIARCRVDGRQGGVAMHPAASGRRIVVRDNDARSAPGARSRQGLHRVGIWLVQVTDGEVRGNQVHDFGVPEQMRGDTLMGVAVEDCPAVSVVQNTVTGLATSAGARSTAGVAAWFSYERLDVVDNIIEGGPEPVGSEGTTPFNVALIIVSDTVTDRSARPRAQGGEEGTTRSEHIMRAVSEMPDVHYSQIGHGTARVTPWRVFPALLRSRPPTTVRGNRIDMRGNVTAVEAQVGGPLLFSDNVVRRTLSVLDEHVLPIVEGSADSLVASANYVGSDGVPLNLGVDPERVAVVGNVTNSDILINGNRLPQQWIALNVQA